MRSNLNNKGRGNIANNGNMGVCVTGDNMIVNVTIAQQTSQHKYSNLGQRLNMAMKAKGVSPYKIEKKFGISRFIVCEYLNNTKEPTLSNIIILADYLNVSLDWLIGRAVVISSQLFLEKRIKDLEKLLKAKDDIINMLKE